MSRYLEPSSLPFSKLLCFGCTWAYKNGKSSCIEACCCEGQVFKYLTRRQCTYCGVTKLQPVLSGPAVDLEGYKQRKDTMDMKREDVTVADENGSASIARAPKRQDGKEASEAEGEIQDTSSAFAHSQQSIGAERSLEASTGPPTTKATTATRLFPKASTTRSHSRADKLTSRSSQIAIFVKNRLSQSVFVPYQRTTAVVCLEC
jgi:hypothetical protein